MATKRKAQFASNDEVPLKKHTLDSDEEDSDDYEKDEINDSDIEGEEDGVAKTQDAVKITPFNMREELQEGHFDTDGHYHWNKNSEVRDNWLDNIDWVKIKDDKNQTNEEQQQEQEQEKDSNDLSAVYNENASYSKVLEFMLPNETVQRTLQRLGKNRSKVSSRERLRLKKLGVVDEAAEKITKFTELTNEILTRTGNMDVYQETYAQIKSKVKNVPTTSKSGASGSDSCDMYADDFEEKEKVRINAHNDDNSQLDAKKNSNDIFWEFKWKQNDEQVQGPFSTQQMLKWTQVNYFKDGAVYVRKVGESTNFYSSARIDFDLYL